MSKVLIHRGYKYRLYPNRAQREALAQTFGCCRYVYNWGLDRKNTVYTETGKTLSIYDLSKELTALKKEKDKLWLKDVLRAPLIQSLRHLDTAFEKFFKKQGGYPQFKKKHGRQSTGYVKDCFRITDRGIRLYKMPGEVKVRFSRPLPKGGEIRKAVVSIDSAGRYFVSITVIEEIATLPPLKAKIGIDLGLTHFATISTGEKIDNPRHFDRHYKRLRRAQKSLSRKKKGSKNRDKARRKVVRIYARIEDARKDFLHKLSTRLISENQAIGTERLRVRNMIKNRRLSRHIGNAGWGEFVRMLQYKADSYGRDVVKADPIFASSKTCSVCGHRIDELPLGIRQWTCPKCSTIHDRDINAAINIKNHTVGMTGL
ncbi:MAG: RNA-guided endonuclease TnpB family protein [Gemmatimonadota bacterium]|nr:RNA-guided endonuclease TnpB family protein [Gemmatimonadota bacterium]MDE2955345.1 RNA-guided endonuclease TnpB family protein [Gemmatimonadota bacterium]